MEVRAEQASRSECQCVHQVGGLGLGDVSITTFGEEGRDLLIRIQRARG